MQVSAGGGLIGGVDTINGKHQNFAKWATQKRNLSRQRSETRRPIVADVVCPVDGGA